LTRVLAIAAVSVFFAITPFGSASAYTEKTLHSFCTGTNCGDGEIPLAGLLMDQSGDLYGTTYTGGKYGWGVVFELVPSGDTYKEHILKNFCTGPNCPDGGTPEADLIVDVDGNLYGTTYDGGKYGAGVVFRLKHQSGHVSYAIIHSFCSKANCTDGNHPDVGLSYEGQAFGALWNESSLLFGTTDYGGADNKGAAYELAPKGSSWAYQVVHSFNPNSDSAQPGPVLVDSSENLFGVTRYGAKYGAGALYRLVASTWKEIILYNFCAQANCTDGSNGVGRLAIDAAGDLYGATNYGGLGGGGVVFEFAVGGVYSPIYKFGSQSGDGFAPEAGPIIDAGGNLYGTTASGGTGESGTVFKLSPGTNWTETVLYDFCSESGCIDGATPWAPVIMDAAGNLYGTTYGGGANGDHGTVFELTP
jgi:uncharacterized repeat protein (TIGR03803 family)